MASVRYQFGDFVLEAKALIKSGEQVALQPLPRKILFHLVANRDRDVPVSELYEYVRAPKPDPSNVAPHISIIRKLLGDDAATARFIATIPGGAFRFVFRPVREESETTEPMAAELAPTETSKDDGVDEPAATQPLQVSGPSRSGLFRKRLIHALVASILGIGVTIWAARYFTSPPTPKGPGVLTVRVLLADFEEDADHSPYRVTREVESGISTLSSPSLPVEVEMLRRKLPWRSDKGGEGSQIEFMLTEAQKRHAEFAVWGEVTKTQATTALAYSLYRINQKGRPEGKTIEVTSPDSNSLERLTAGRTLASVVAQEMLFAIVNSAVARGHVVESVAMLESVLRRLGTFREPAIRAQVLDVLGDCKQRLNDAPSAIKAYSEAVALDPNRRGSRAKRGVLLSRAKDFSAALADLRSAASDRTLDDSLRLDVILSLGDCLFLGEKKLDAAWEQYNIAAALAPKDARPLLGRGTMAQRLGRESAAQVDFNAAHAINPSLTESLLTRVR